MTNNATRREKIHARTGVRRSVEATARGLALALVLCGATYAQDAGMAPAPQTPQSKSEAAPAPEAPAPTPETSAVVIDDQGVSSLLGKEVVSATDDKIGRIVDLLVARDGELRAVVIDFGGFLGVGSRRVAVTWHALRFGADGTIGVRMTADDLRVTPEYRQGQPVVVVSPSETRQHEGKEAPPQSGPQPQK